MSITVNREMRLFQRLFISLWETKFNESIYSNPHAGMFSQYPPISTSEVLQAYLPKEGKVAGNFKYHYLWLIPSTHGDRVHPVLYLTYDFSRIIPEVKLRLALFLHHKKDPKAIGFRFESPEGEGKHHFYHVQMIYGFSKDENFGPNYCPEWLPVKEPTFLLPAVDSVSLVLHLISSIYGIRDTNQILNAATQGDEQVRRMYTEILLPKRFEELLWYWKAVSKTSKETYIETHLPPDDFKPEFSKNSSFAGHSLNPVIPEDYQRAKNREKIKWPK